MRDNFKRERAAMPKDMQKQVKDALKKATKRQLINIPFPDKKHIDIKEINKRNEGCF